MIKNILTNLKIEQLNAMQEAAIDTWKEGKDLILLSPTGSGKTLERCSGHSACTLPRTGFADRPSFQIHEYTL